MFLAVERLTASRGVMIVEMAFVTLVLLMLLLLMVWSGLTLSFLGTLSKGAHEGVNLATKIDSIDLPAGNPELDQALAAVRLAALRFPDGVGYNNNGALQATVLRPGDTAHPTCSTLNCEGTPATVRELMRIHPIVVEVRGTSPAGGLTFTDHNGQVTATAVGFREFG